MPDVTPTTCQPESEVEPVDCATGDDFLKISPTEFLKINPTEFLIIRRRTWDEVDHSTTDTSKEISKTNCQ